MGFIIGFSVYFLLINVIAFLTMRLDKRGAQKGRRRVPESSLMSMAIFFGAPGILLGMRHFRHKTKKLKFTYGVPLIFGAEIIFLVFILMM